jgi:transcriptional regulator with XRE-family HTH domain
VVQPTAGAARALAERLRSLRQNGWESRRITQEQLARALHRSEALISSWERRVDPVTPPVDRLKAYATFFATKRSVESDPYRVLADHELTPDETAVRDGLRSELLELRAAAVADPSMPVPVARVDDGSLVGRGPWHFGDGGRVIIVCPELPPDILDGIPHASPENLDYTELSRLTDLDALFELHGHIRAVNPDSQVEYLPASRMGRDEAAAHVVVLGGVDWNDVQRDFLRLSDAPVVQRSEDGEPNRGGFEVVGDAPHAFAPVLEQRDKRPVLVEDVGHFYRGPNPLNREQSVTLCNGMFSRGVFGAVRTLTDKQFRDRNAEFIENRFGGVDAFSILFRVPVINNDVVTPDWTAAGTVLHTWPGTIG